MCFNYRFVSLPCLQRSDTTFSYRVWKFIRTLSYERISCSACMSFLIALSCVFPIAYFLFSRCRCFCIWFPIWILSSLAVFSFFRGHPLGWHQKVLLAHLKAIGLIRFSMVKMPEIIKENAEMQSNNQTKKHTVVKSALKIDTRDSNPL